MHKGKLMGGLTLGRLGEEHFMQFGPGGMQDAHQRWFECHLPGTRVDIEINRAGYCAEVQGCPLYEPQGLKMRA